jgi:sugar lactone lactonase YvrE
MCLCFAYCSGKCDPEGRFWAGTMAIEEPRGPCGALYVWEKGVVRKVATDVTVSNGLVWLPSGDTMLYIDSPTRCVDRMAYDRASGSVSNRRVAFRLEDHEGFPDGCTLDSQGRLWLAQWGAARVTCRDADSGAVHCTVHLPTPHTSACAFGPNGDLYVTSAREGLTPEELASDPYAGSLFRIPASILHSHRLYVPSNTLRVAYCSVFSLKACRKSVSFVNNSF